MSTISFKVQEEMLKLNLIIKRNPTLFINYRC